MAAIGMILMLVGWLVALVGGIMILIKAFQASIWWGLGSLFIPFVILVFVALNWEDSKQGFLIWLAGFVVAIVGMVLGAMFGAAASSDMGTPMGLMLMLVR